MTSAVESPVPVTPVAPVPADLAARLVRNTGVLTVANLFVRGLGMVMMVMLARYLGAAGYGTYQRSEAFVYLFSIIANLGLDMILTRQVARRDPRAAEFLGGCFALKLALGAATCALVLGIAYARGYQGDFLYGIWAYAFVLLFNSVGQAMDAVFQGRESMGFLALANLANQVAILVLGVACILAGKDPRWILGSLVVASAIRLAVSTALLLRLRVRWERPRAATLAYLLRQSLPIAFAASFVIIYQQVDAVMLGEMKGNAEVGWYRAGAKFLLFFTVLRESFLIAVYPIFSSVAHVARQRLGYLVTRAVRYQVIVSLFFLLCFLFLSRVAPKLLGAEFQNSATVLPIMSWILIPQVISITAGRALIASGNQNRIMVATGLSLAVNVGLNLLLIPRYSYLGAATSSVASETVVAALNLLYVNRLVARTTVMRSLARPLLAAAVAGVALYQVRSVHLYFAFPLAALFYGTALWALRAFSHDEIVQFRSLTARAWARARRRPAAAGPAWPGSDEA